MNWQSIPFRRLFWTIPAALAGALAYIAFYLATERLKGLFPGELILGALVLHAIAWVLFIVPFAWLVPETSKLYRFPISALWGALFGGAACFIVAMGFTILMGISTGRAFNAASEAAPLCAVSGAAVAAVMSLAKILSGRVASVRAPLEGK
jgi:hypothetical protein